MGALASNRKRSDEFSRLDYAKHYSHSPDFRVSKRTKFSLSPSTSESFDKQSVVSSRSAASRLARYPEATAPLSREVHAPCRTGKFKFWNKNWGSFDKGKHSESMGNALSCQYERAKSVALGALRYVTRKEVIDVDNESKKDKIVVPDDSSVEEIINLEEDGKEGQSAVSEEGNEVVVGDLPGKDVKVLPTDSVSDMTEDVVRVDDAGKMMDSLSLERIQDASGDVAVYKKLLENIYRKSYKFEQLEFDIELNEKKLSAYDLYRTEKEQPKEEIPVEPFVPLTEEDEEFVDNAFAANRRKVLVTHKDSNIEITGEILLCLRPRAWLNDEVINLYLELLKEREKREPKRFLKCHFFNTFFYKKLISGRGGYDYKSVRRWTTQRKLGYMLGDCDKIFVPIHKEIHWCLAVINKRDKKFQYLDSLGGRDTQVLKVLARYFVDEVKDKSGIDIDLRSWKQEFVEDLPEQQNGYDCGVFMIKYADFYSRGLELCFNQEHMPYFRRRTAKEILRLRAD